MGTPSTDLFGVCALTRTLAIKKLKEVHLLHLYMEEFGGSHESMPTLCATNQSCIRLPKTSRFDTTPELRACLVLVG
jgi:hypothetical protein